MKILVLILCLFVVLACNPPKDLNRNEYRDENIYPQNFRTTEAFLVLEWNSRKPHIMASGTLRDKKKGIFSTAKHFTDEFGKLGVDYCKVFFNGKVYRATLELVPAIRDAALIRLVPPFDSSDFPEVLPIASEAPKMGDKIYIQGFHPHPFWLGEINKGEGFPDTEVDIFRTYYDEITKDKTTASKISFDNLESTRVNPDPQAVINNKYLSDAEKIGSLEYENDRFIKIITARDHRYSFGGLSGGAALNSKNEIVGINTAQDIFRFEYDDQGFQFIPGVGEAEVTEVKKQFFDTLYITPTDSVKDLEEYIKTVK